MDGAEVKGDVLLGGNFSAEGEVRLDGAVIGGQLACRGGTFKNPDARALGLDWAEVKDDVFLSGNFSAEGKVSLLGARIGGSVLFAGSRFAAPGEKVLNFEHATITGALDLTRMAAPPVGDIDLRNARVGRLDDDARSWPGLPHRVMLDGFVYGGMQSPGSAKSRLAWIERQGGGERFRVQPYEQLAGYYDSIGHDRDARDVRIAERRAVRADGKLSQPQKAWSYFLDGAVRFGFNVSPTFWFGVLVLVLGSLIFSCADDPTIVRDRPGVVAKEGEAARPGEGPAFFGPVYALDTFLPIIDLGQEGAFHVDTRERWDLGFTTLPGEWVQGYLWFHILAGWAVSTLFVVSFTGLVRKK